MSDLQQPPVPDTQGRGCIYATVVFVALIISLPFLLSYLKKQSALRFQEHLAVKRIESFQEVKQGQDRVTIYDPLLLPMLAEDEDCIRNLRSIDFFMTSVGPEEAKHIARLTNLKTIGFYDTGGTEHVIAHARGLGVERVWYGGIYYLSEQDIRHLAEFPQLTRLGLANPSSDAEEELLESLLPHVKIEDSHRIVIDPQQSVPAAPQAE